MAIQLVSGMKLVGFATNSILKVDTNGILTTAVDGVDYNTSTSQWTNTNGGIYYSDSVRVGTYQAGVLPGAKLHVFDYQTTTPKFLIEDGNTGDASMEFKISTQSYTMGIDNSDSDKFVLAASTALGTTNVLEVASTGAAAFQEGVLFSKDAFVSGNLGVGTTSPIGKLDVANDGLFLTSTNTSSRNWLVAGNYLAWGDFALVQSDAFGTDPYPPANSTPRFYISTAGNVGIGTTSPASKLHVAKAGNRNGGSMLIGETGSGTAKWSYLAGAHYDQSSGSGNGSGSAGMALIGGLSSATYNQVKIGGGPYEINPATEIQFWTHTSTTHTLGGSQRMTIKSDGSLRLHAYTAGLLKTDANGNVSLDTNTYLTSLPSHTHDTRYYTKTQSDTKYLTKGDSFIPISMTASDYEASAEEVVLSATNSYRGLAFPNGAKDFEFEVSIKGSTGANHQGVFWGATDLTSLIGAGLTGYKTTHQNADNLHIRDIANNSNQMTVDPGFAPDDGQYHRYRLVQYRNSETDSAILKVYLDGNLIFDTDHGGFNSPPQQPTYFGFIVHTGDVKYAHWNVRDITDSEDLIRTIGEDVFQPIGNYLTSLPAHEHDARYYTETEMDGFLSGKLSTSGGVLTGALNVLYNDHANGTGWDNNLFIGTSDDLGLAAAFPTYVPSGSYGFFSHAYSDGVFIGSVPVSAGATNYYATIAWGDDATEYFQFLYKGSQVARLDTVGRFYAYGGNSEEWNAAYSWGNHAGLYLGATAKAADSNLLDGIDSTGFVKQLSDGSSPNYQTPSSRRVNPNADNPTNEHYAITTYGNNGNVTGQLATHFQTGQLYSRGYNSSWSAWKKYATEDYAAAAAQAVQTNLEGLESGLGSAAAADTTDFAPASHVHDYLRDSHLVGQSTQDANDADSRGVTVRYLGTGASNKPSGVDHSLLTLSYSTSWSTQLAGDWRTKQLYFRTQENGTWKSWATIYHSDNLNIGTLDGYTQNEVDTLIDEAPYLPVAGKAADSNLLDGIDSGSFLRSDANDTGSGKLTLTYNDSAEPYAPLEIRGGGNHTGLYINPHANKQGHIRFAANGALKWQMRVPFQDGVNSPLKIYSWVDGADRYTFNHNGYLNTVGLTALGGYVRSQYNSTQYAQIESNASGGVVKGSGGGGFFFRSYGDSYFNGGKVGIGTSDPETFIHINGGHGDARSQITYNHAADPTHVNSSNLLQWVSEPGITYQGAGIGSNINKGGQYYGRYNNSVNYGVYLRFDPVNGYSEFHATTGNSGVTGGQGVRVFRIGPTGNTSISGFLNVSSTATIDDAVSIGADGTYGAGYGTVGFGGTTNGYNRIFGRTSTGDGLFLASATGRGIFFRTNGSSIDSMSINPSGQVGIGVDSARGKLELNGSGQSWSTAPGIRVWDSYNSKGWFVGSANNVATGDFYIRTLPGETDNPAAANQKEFVIKHSTGNVGIGTLSPSSKLEVDGVVSATGGNSTNWNTAYSQRNRWDGGSAGLNAATGRTSLGLGSAATSENSDFAPASHTHPYLPLSGGTMTGNLVMEDEAINFKSGGSSTLPQFFGHRSTTDLNSRWWTSEGGWAYTTFEAASTNAPTGATNNANGLLTFNTHVGDYGHQLAFTNTGTIYNRSRNGGSFGSWRSIATGDELQQLETYVNDNFLSSVPSTFSATAITLSGIKLEESSDRPGILEINRDGSNAYAGIMTKFSGTAEWALMGDETAFGLYDDQNNDWAWRYTENSNLVLYSDGVVRAATKSDGFQIKNTLELGALATTDQGILKLSGSTANKESILKTTNGNLHIDSADGHSLYLNYYTGTTDNIIFGNGNTGNSGAKITSGGVVHATGGNSGQWNTAYGWGNHASAGYLTSYTETDTLASVTSRGASTTTSLSIRELTSRNIFPEADRTYILGRDDLRWQIVFCEVLDSAGLHEKNLQNPEGEKSVGDYETGTVLVWKGGKNVPCTESADHMRMGIAVKGVSSPLVQGAEPVLCTGEVNEGDYLVTSSVEGHAAAISPQYMRQHNLFDCVLGKALEGGNGDSHIIKTWVNI